MLAPWKKSCDKPRQHIKKQKHHFADKGQSYVFSSSLVWMWELDHKEDWAPKNWCLWTVVLEKTFENPLDNKDIKPVNPKGNQPWRFIERTDAEGEVPTVWPPDVKSQLIGIDPDPGKDWDESRRRRWATEDKMVGWHHWLNGYKFEQAPGDSEQQGSLECCSPWGCKESEMTGRLNRLNRCSIRRTTFKTPCMSVSCFSFFVDPDTLMSSMYTFLEYLQVTDLIQFHWFKMTMRIF